jgi:hypothetical protein
MYFHLLQFLLDYYLQVFIYYSFKNIFYFSAYCESVKRDLEREEKNRILFWGN